MALYREGRRVRRTSACERLIRASFVHCHLNLAISRNASRSEGRSVLLNLSRLPPAGRSQPPTFPAPSHDVEGSRPRQAGCSRSAGWSRCVSLRRERARHDVHPNVRFVAGPGFRDDRKRHRVPSKRSGLLKPRFLTPGAKGPHFAGSIPSCTSVGA
jgi:hypothetical protein